MIASILHGFGAAVVVSLALAMAAASGASQSGMSGTIVVIVLLTALIASVQKMYSRGQKQDASSLDLERYDGVADILIHLHTPALPDRPSRWTLRGLLSWVLSGLGLGIGPEGVAMELSQAVGMNTRSSSTRWSDLRRRTDAAQALAAGISAGFGAPFAAVLLPAELSIGGRVLSSVLASISAYVGVEYLTSFFGQFGIRILSFQERLQHLWGFRFTDAGEWFSMLLVCFVSALIAALVLPGVQAIRDLQERLGNRRAEWATVGAGILLLSVVVLGGKAGIGSPAIFLESVIRNELPTRALISLAVSLFLVLSAVYSGWGSLGVWWPSFLMGAAVSMLVARGVLATGWVHSGVAANAALLGAVAWSVVWFRTPITLAVLAYELSGNGSLLLPALLAGWIAGVVARRFPTRSWIQGVLESKQFPIREGRSVAVLQLLTAGDAMVRDFQSVRERDSIQTCHEMIHQCRYPFLAVVNDSGAFTGLLTVDIIEQGLQMHHELAQQERDAVVSRLEGFLEARDLLSSQPQMRGAIRTARVGTQLSELTSVFESQICLPVLSDEGRPVGLVFSSDVRHAYDRELARISIMLQARNS
jgi:CIC family chloride channel protein